MEFVEENKIGLYETAYNNDITDILITHIENGSYVVGLDDTLIEMDKLKKDEYEYITNQYPITVFIFTDMTCGGNKYILPWTGNIEKDDVMEKHLLYLNSLSFLGMKSPKTVLKMYNHIDKKSARNSIIKSLEKLDRSQGNIVITNTSNYFLIDLYYIHSRLLEQTRKDVEIGLDLLHLSNEYDFTDNEEISRLKYDYYRYFKNPPCVIVYSEKDQNGLDVEFLHLSFEKSFLLIK